MFKFLPKVLLKSELFPSLSDLSRKHRDAEAALEYLDFLTKMNRLTAMA